MIQIGIINDRWEFSTIIKFLSIFSILPGTGLPMLLLPHTIPLQMSKFYKTKKRMAQQNGLYSISGLQNKTNTNPKSNQTQHIFAIVLIEVPVRPLKHNRPIIFIIFLGRLTESYSWCVIFHRVYQYFSVLTVQKDLF